jgi:tetratricopeptide (TPR) repeat protein
MMRGAIASFLLISAACSTARSAEPRAHGPPSPDVGAPGAQAGEHAGCAIGYGVSIPQELLERPIRLREGTGNEHDPVTTKSSEAQALYDQGLQLLHSYALIDASRSFYQALRADPNLALAWVGLSRAYVGLQDRAAARKAVARALALSGSVSEPEKRRVQLEQKRLDAIDDLENPAKQREYKQALNAALSKDFADLELWILRGNAEEPTADGWGQRGDAASVAFYEHVLALAPDHAAAHHYLIHSFENLGRIAEALQHGEAYAKSAPAIPHAHHMYGHDLRRASRAREAIERFRKADELERAYFQTESIPPELDWHHGHNLNLLAASLEYIGQIKEAEAFLHRSFDLPAAVDVQAFFKQEWPAFLLRRGRAEDALGAAERLAADKRLSTRFAGQLLRSKALMKLGRLDEAKAALREAHTHFDALPTVVRQQTVGRRLAEPYLNLAEGELLFRDPATRPQGREQLIQAATQVRLGAHPDAWLLALFDLETIFALGHDTDDWGLAEAIARLMLEHDPSYGGTHAVLALVAGHKADPATEKRELELAAQAWRDADPEFDGLSRARRSADPKATTARH